MGAGDALAAGLAVALAQGRDLRSAARLAVAAGSASVEHPRAGRLDPRRAAELAGSLGISQYS
jgi:sugar/nucleoside kinase (ribokinase family)